MKKRPKRKTKKKKKNNNKDLHVVKSVGLLYNKSMNKIKMCLTNFWSFLKKHKWSVGLVLTALIIGGFFIWDSFSASGFTPSDIILKQKPKDTRVHAPLSGNLVTEELAERRPIAVVVENHPDARPQSGLNSASLVYETFAEGGITRFLAFFQENEPKEIGPVRSARVYFVEWATSYRAIFAHVGGNIEALEMIPKLNIEDVNQFYFSKYFWRDNTRYAPHNVYTTIQKLYDAVKSKNKETTDKNISSFVFKKDIEKEKRPIANSFTVFFNQSYAVTYNYLPEDNYYYRNMLKSAQKDKTSGEQIKAKNVIVCYSDFSYGKTKIGEQKTIIRTTGSGTANFFIDGVKTEGKWSRINSSSITRFYNTDGTELKLNPGTTWVEFVPQGTQVY